MAGVEDVNLSVDDIKRMTRDKNLDVIHSNNKRVKIHTILDRIDTRNKRFNIFHKDIDKYLIHYETGVEGKYKMGHWCVLIIDNKRKEALFFDPLGFFPDNQLNIIKEAVKEKTDQLERHIGKLLYALSNRGYKVFYNEIPFQKMESKTCGRYCALVLLLSKTRIIQPEEIKEILNLYKHLGDYDDIIINLTSKL